MKKIKLPSKLMAGAGSIKKINLGSKLSAGTSAIKKIKIPNKDKIKRCVKNNAVSKFIASSLGIKIIVWFCFVMALAEVGFGVMIYKFKSEDKFTKAVASVIPYPVAIVNQNFISYSDYLHEKNYIHHFYAATEQEGVDYAAIDSEIINQLVENKLLSFQLLLQKTNVSDEDVQNTLDQIIEQNGGQDKVEKILNDLYGLNLKQFKALVRTQMVRDKLNDQVIMRVSASHILVRVDKNAPQDQVDAAKAKIDGYLNEIKGGLDFAEAAKKYSEDTGSAEQGGKLDPFSEGEMVPEFSNAAFSAEPGSIVGPIRTDFGWHIIKVESKTGKVSKSFAEWLSDLKNKSFIIKFI